MFKKKFLVYILILVPLIAVGQKSTGGYQFEVTKQIEVLPVENQYMSSTCWSFSTLSMLESDLIRMGKGKIDLSEMFIVRNVFIEKAIKYVRMHGAVGFTGGGALNDVTDIIAKYGIVPNQVYTGLQGNATNHIHYKMDTALLEYVDGVIKNHKLDEKWLEGVVDILDVYLGKVPEKFTYKGEKYTPESFTEFLGLNMNDYVLITSYTHHPFYQKFILEVPDNWSWGQPYNLPLDEMIQVIDASVEQGYTVAWASDVTEPGFSWREGIAISPKKADKGIFEEPVPEITVSQQLRQEEFDNYQTTDDHGMHIIGFANDVKGNKYYYVKNSWGINNAQKGYIFASENFVRYKTMSILVNKNAIPEEILLKLKME